ALLRQQQEVADPVPMSPEVGGMTELIHVSFGPVGPDVLDLVSDVPGIGQLAIDRGEAGLLSDVVGDAGKQPMELPTVLLMNIKIIPAVEVLILCDQPRVKGLSELDGRESADLTHDVE